MKKIESLTPEQEALIPVYVKKYLDNAFNGSRIDTTKLSVAFTEAYAEIGSASPQLLVFDSPYAALMAIAFVKNISKFKTNATVDTFMETGDTSLWPEIFAEYGDQIKQKCKGNIWDSNFLWGSQDGYWVGWGKFVEHIGAELEEETSRRLDIMDRIGEQCEWWWPFENFVVASQKPVKVKFDDRELLHCEDGYAIEYADGYGVAMWHGTRIPIEWVTSKKPTAHEALTWENIEQRRCACEILGWDNIIDQLDDVKIVDEDPNPEIGTLISANIPDIGKEQFLRVKCGTGRTFALPVPPTMKTAKQANAWTYGFDDPEDYMLEIRT
jgi:hypothetical protein